MVDGGCQQIGYLFFVGNNRTMLFQALDHVSRIFALDSSNDFPDFFRRSFIIKFAAEIFP